MKLSPLKLGDRMVQLPIFQGGMAVRVSLAPLAAAVANCGGAGTIAGTGMSSNELIQEIRKARRMTDGILGVNVLFAIANFADLIKAAVNEKIDFVVSGAGFSRDMFTWGKEAGVPVIPIVSSAKLGRISEKLGASAVVVEGKEAGGHLGTDRPIRDILPEVRKAVDIPVIAAGGIVSGEDIADIVGMGADGVQMATRFVLSEECTVADSFKELYLKAEKKDVVMIKSPVGFPGRALRNPLTEKIESQEKIGIDSCNKCLKVCSNYFCIMEALKKAEKGYVVDGLVFSGENVYKIQDILPVGQIMKNLVDRVYQIKG